MSINVQFVQKEMTFYMFIKYISISERFFFFSFDPLLFNKFKFLSKMFTFIFNLNYYQFQFLHFFFFKY